MLYINQTLSAPVDNMFAEHTLGLAGYAFIEMHYSVGWGAKYAPIGMQFESSD